MLLCISIGYVEVKGNRRVTRLMKENSVDCLLNIGQTILEAKMMSIEENRNKELVLSSNKRKTTTLVTSPTL